MNSTMFPNKEIYYDNLKNTFYKFENNQITKCGVYGVPLPTFKLNDTGFKKDKSPVKMNFHIDKSLYRPVTSNFDGYFNFPNPIDKMFHNTKMYQPNDYDSYLLRKHASKIKSLNSISNNKKISNANLHYHFNNSNKKDNDNNVNNIISNNNIKEKDKLIPKLELIHVKNLNNKNVNYNINTIESTDNKNIKNNNNNNIKNNKNIIFTNNNKFANNINNNNNNLITNKTNRTNITFSSIDSEQMKSNKNKNKDYKYSEDMRTMRNLISQRYQNSLPSNFNIKYQRELPFLNDKIFKSKIEADDKDFVLKELRKAIESNNKKRYKSAEVLFQNNSMKHTIYKINNDNKFKVFNRKLEEPLDVFKEKFNKNIKYMREDERLHKERYYDVFSTKYVKEVEKNEDLFNHTYSDFVKGKIRNVLNDDTHREFDSKENKGKEAKVRFVGNDKELIDKNKDTISTANELSQRSIDNNNDVNNITNLKIKINDLKIRKSDLNESMTNNTNNNTSNMNTENTNKEYKQQNIKQYFATSSNFFSKNISKFKLPSKNEQQLSPPNTKDRKDSKHIIKEKEKKDKQKSQAISTKTLTNITANRDKDEDLEVSIISNNSNVSENFNKLMSKTYADLGELNTNINIKASSKIQTFYYDKDKKFLTGFKSETPKEKGLIYKNINTKIKSETELTKKDKKLFTITNPIAISMQKRQEDLDLKFLRRKLEAGKVKNKNLYENKISNNKSKNVEGNNSRSRSKKDINS